MDAALLQKAASACLEVRRRKSYGEDVDTTPEGFAKVAIEVADQWYAVNPHEDWERANATLKHEVRGLRSLLREALDAFADGEYPTQAEAEAAQEAAILRLREVLR